MRQPAAGSQRASWPAPLLLASGSAALVLAMRYARGSDLRAVLGVLLAYLALLLAGSLPIPLVAAWRGSIARRGEDLLAGAERVLSGRRASLLLAGGMALYAVVWSLLSILRHAGLNSSGFDLAIQHQVIWSLAHGKGYASSIEVSNYLGDHVALILPLLAPLLWVWDDVRILLIAQSVILSLGACPVFRLASRRCGSRAEGLLWALVYLCLPAVGFMNKYDFHEIVLAVPILLAAIDAMDEGRWHAAGLWSILAIATREEIGLAVAALGLWCAIGRRKRAWGIGLCALGLAWAVFALYFVIPHFRGGQSSDTLARYAWLGGSPGEIARTILTRPWALFATHYHRVRRLIFPLQLLWPFGGLPVFSPALLALALPNVALSITSSAISQNSIYFQYNAPILPILFLAGIAGARRLILRGRSRGAVYLLLLLSLAAANVADPAAWKGVGRPYTVVDGIRPRPNRAAFAAAARMIPPEAGLLASNNLAPHFSGRERLGVIQIAKPNPEADFVICDLTDRRHLSSPADLGRLIEAWIARGEYAPRFCRDGILVLQRGGDGDPGAGAVLQGELARLLAESPATR